jgi:hypothetical protein
MVHNLHMTKPNRSNIESFATLTGDQPLNSSLNGEGNVRYPWELLAGFKDNNDDAKWIPFRYYNSSKSILYMTYKSDKEIKAKMDVICHGGDCNFKKDGNVTTILEKKLTTIDIKLEKGETEILFEYTWPLINLGEQREVSILVSCYQLPTSTALPNQGYKKSFVSISSKPNRNVPLNISYGKGEIKIPLEKRPESSTDKILISGFLKPGPHNFNVIGSEVEFFINNKSITYDAKGTATFATMFNKVVEPFIGLKNKVSNVINKAAADQRAADQRAADQRAADQRAADQRAADQRAADQRAAAVKAAADQRAADQRAAAVKAAADQRAADQRAADQRAADRAAVKAAADRAADQRAAVQRAADQRAAVKAAADRAADQRAADQRAAVKAAADRAAVKAAAVKAAAVKAAADQRAADQRAADQRAADQRAADQRAAADKAAADKAAADKAAADKAAADKAAADKAAAARAIEAKEKADKEKAEQDQKIKEEKAARELAERLAEEETARVAAVRAANEKILNDNTRTFAVNYSVPVPYYILWKHWGITESPVDHLYVTSKDDLSFSLLPNITPLFVSNINTWYTSKPKV